MQCSAVSQHRIPHQHQKPHHTVAHHTKPPLHRPTVRHFHIPLLTPSPVVSILAAAASERLTRLPGWLAVWLTLLTVSALRRWEMARNTAADFKAFALPAGDDEEEEEEGDEDGGGGEEEEAEADGAADDGEEEEEEEEDGEGLEEVEEEDGVEDEDGADDMAAVAVKSYVRTSFQESGNGTQRAGQSDDGGCLNIAVEDETVCEIERRRLRRQLYEKRENRRQKLSNDVGSGSC